MIRPAALLVFGLATTLAASLPKDEVQPNAAENQVTNNRPPVSNGGNYGYPGFPPYGYAANFGAYNYGFPGNFPQPPFMPFPAPYAAMPFDFNGVFNAYINALQQYTENLQKLQQQFQQQQASISSRYAKDSSESGTRADGGRGILSDLREAFCRTFVVYLGRDPNVCSNPGPSYFVGTASGASTGPGQISVSAPPGAVVQHFEGPGGLQGVAVSSGSGYPPFAGGAAFAGGAPFSAGSFGGPSGSNVGGAPFSAGTFGGATGSNVGGGGVFTSSSSGVSSVNGHTETFHQSTTGHVDNQGHVSSITVSKP